MTISVCTTDDGRREHLANLIRGLRGSIRPPGELVIAVRHNELRELPEASFPIRQTVLRDEPMSLARAHNAAAARTSGELLVFLDCACIAHPNMLDDYARAARRGGLLMGEVGFLPPGATTDGVDHAHLQALAVAHPDHPAPSEEAVEPCRDYRRFSSLNFAVPALDYVATGGFDERYVGHGGEDIDFSRAAMSAGLPFALLRGAKAYHQHCGEQMPPVAQLDGVLANVELFREKWDQPVLEDWLHGFERMGLVERTESGWRKLREPDARDIALSERQADEPFASSAAMLEQFEPSERRAAGGKSASMRPAA